VAVATGEIEPVSRFAGGLQAPPRR